MNAPGALRVSTDPWDLYQASVQDSTAQARVLEHLFRRIHRRRTPKVLREDFAGTAQDALAWISLDPAHTALAVELDPAVVERARARSRAILRSADRRLSFIQSRVEDLRPDTIPRADIVAALNFSIGYLHDRSTLVAYLRQVRQSLAPRGIFVASVFGGAQSVRPHRESFPIARRPARRGSPATPAFEYVWEVHGFNPVQQRGDFRIHFRIPGNKKAEGVGEEIADAFRYDWRVWSLPELTEALREAGFHSAEVWRHTLEESSGGRPKVFIGPVDDLQGVDPWVVYGVGTVR
jgi:SAM-dependent methyltransferase